MTGSVSPVNLQVTARDATVSYLQRRWAQIQDGKYRSIGRTINLDSDGKETVDVDMVGLGRWD